MAADEKSSEIFFSNSNSLLALKFLPISRSVRTFITGIVCFSIESKIDNNMLFNLNETSFNMFSGVDF